LLRVERRSSRARTLDSRAGEPEEGEAAMGREAAAAEEEEEEDGVEGSEEEEEEEEEDDDRSTVVLSPVSLSLSVPPVSPSPLAVTVPLSPAPRLTGVSL